jgi:hypothetical protein
VHNTASRIGDFSFMHALKKIGYFSTAEYMFPEVNAVMASEKSSIASRTHFSMYVRHTYCVYVT